MEHWNLSGQSPCCVLQKMIGSLQWFCIHSSSKAGFRAQAPLLGWGWDFLPSYNFCMTWCACMISFFSLPVCILLPYMAPLIFCPSLGPMNRLAVLLYILGRCSESEIISSFTTAQPGHWRSESTARADNRSPVKILLKTMPLDVTQRWLKSDIYGKSRRCTLLRDHGPLLRILFWFTVKIDCWQTNFYVFDRCIAWDLIICLLGMD